MSSGRHGPDKEGAGESPVDPADPIATRRKLVEVRLEIADVASKAAEADLARVFEAVESYGSRAELQARAEAAWDPAAVRAAKDAAHHAFKLSVASAQERANVEAAASAWLDEINRVNTSMRTAQAEIKRERDLAAALLAEIDRLCIEAGASRARADAAIDSGRAARLELNQALGIDEADAGPIATLPGAVPAAAPVPPTPALSNAPAEAVAREAVPAPAAAPATDEVTEPEARSEDELAPAGPRPPSPDAVDIAADPRQVIVALLGRDGDALTGLARRLAGEDGEALLVWETWLHGLLDACAAVAVDEGYLEFLPGHPFWGLFTAQEARGIGKALAELGFRHDGRGGFLADRVPTPHDLVVAAGAAGLLTVRVRHWPAPEEIVDLYRDVRVAADLLVAERASFLTLGEVVSLLGWRAEPLADLWNEWPKVRPLLLKPDPIRPEGLSEGGART